MNGDLDPQRRQYATPQADELQAALPELAESIRAQLLTVYSDPSSSRCDGVLLSLYGAMTHLQRLRMTTNNEKARITSAG